MQLYEMQVSKTAITRAAPARVPKGLVGAVVKLSFSPEWEGLTKTVVFRAGEITKDILDVKDAAVIPAECTREEGALLEIGVYGVDAGNTVAIPTLWAAIGRVSEAADPSGDVTTDPQLPVYAQLQAQIDQLERQGITQNEIDQAIRDFFGGERPVGRTTPEGGEIFNDYENNKALARYAKAEGQGTVVAAQCQHVQGRYNAEDTEKAHIVGGGTSDADRKNIYALDWDGNAEFAGKVYSGGVELAPIGLVYSAIRIASGTDEDLMAKIDGIYAQMADNTVRYISVSFGEKHPTLGGTAYLVTIYRCTNIYGYLEAGTYVDQRFKRSFYNGVWGAWENHSHSAFAPSGFGLGTVNPPVVSDLNTCLGNGWYYTGEQTLNVPAKSYFGYAVVHVTARTSQQIAQRLVSVGHYTRLEMLRYTLDGGETWVEEWVNPPMVPYTEYRTTKRSNSYPIYTKSVSFGALPVGNGVNNAGVKQVSCGVNANKIISLTGYAYKDGEFNPLPMGTSGTLGAYFYVTGSDIGVTAMKDLSSYTAGFVIEYIK